METTKKANVIILISLLVLAGCGYEAASNLENASNQTLPEGSDNFAAIQSNIIRPSCLKCHNGPDSNGDLSTYEAVLTYVTPGKPESSSFFTLIDSGKMPRRAPKLSQSAIDVVRSWIAKGALNN